MPHATFFWHFSAGTMNATYFSMNNTIKIEVKQVYGVTKFYPACEVSALFARMQGTKTLTSDALKIIKALGYSIEQVQNTFTF